MQKLVLPASSCPYYSDGYVFLNAIVKLVIAHEVPQDCWMDNTMTL